MKSIILINTYLTNNAGMSGWIDNRLAEVRQALQDADWRKDEGDEDWHKVNMMIAQKITETILQAIPYKTPVRTYIADIYRAINDEN